MNISETKLTMRFLYLTLLLVLGCCFSLASASSANANANVNSQGEDKDDVKPRRRSSRSLTREDSRLLSVFKPIAISANDSTVKVMGGRRQIAVGTIVSSDGLILTKASEMKGELKCRLPDGTVEPASVVGIDVENDLALLKVAVDGLAAAPLREVAPPKRGSWVVSPIDGTGKISVGVVGVEEREIPKSRAFIGISMLDVGNGIQITQVVPKTPAERAGLQPEDILLKLDDYAVKNIAGLREKLEQYSPESQISITLLRDDKKLVIRLTLADARTASPQNNRSLTQNSMGSRLSRRSMDFPKAFQHDTALQSFQCGGPVVDVDGQIVGINVARAGRVSSLAIPVETVLRVIEKLKGGDYSPVTVFADQIELVELQLKRLEKELLQNTETVQEQIEGFASKSAKIEELERMRKEISNRISEMYKEREELEKSKTVLSSKNSQAEKEKRKLEMQLDALRSGKRY